MNIHHIFIQPDACCTSSTRTCRHDCTVDFPLSFLFLQCVLFQSATDVVLLLHVPFHVPIAYLICPHFANEYHKNAVKSDGRVGQSQRLKMAGMPQPLGAWSRVDDR